MEEKEEGNKFSIGTPIGRMEATFTSHGLSRLSLVEPKITDTDVHVLGLPSDPRLETLRRFLFEYFSGRDPGLFTLPLDFIGLTEFQKKVLSELSFQGTGTLTTYKELAERLGKPKSYRSVGAAVGSNPFLIVIPCHRVVASGKKGGYSLGGFGAGLDVKRFLLRLEGHDKDVKGL